MKFQAASVEQLVIAAVVVFAAYEVYQFFKTKGSSLTPAGYQPAPGPGQNAIGNVVDANILDPLANDGIAAYNSLANSLKSDTGGLTYTGAKYTPSGYVDQKSDGLTHGSGGDFGTPPDEPFIITY